MTIVIETARLLLREWTLEDVEGFFALGSDARVMRFITGGRPLRRDEAEAFVARQIATERTQGWCRWALELRDSPEAAREIEGVVGFCGPGCTFAPDVEIGWWLRSELWGRGLATEAALAAAGYCFETIGFDRLISVIDPENSASRRVAEKIGFRPAGEIVHAGRALARYQRRNPLADPPRDPRFCRDCAGAPAGSVLDPAETTPSDGDGP